MRKWTIRNFHLIILTCENYVLRDIFYFWSLSCHVLYSYLSDLLSDLEGIIVMIFLYPTCMNMLYLDLHFIFFGIKPPVPLYKVGLLLFLDLQMFLFYIYIKSPLILTQWCYPLLPWGSQIPYSWSNSSLLRPLDFN